MWDYKDQKVNENNKKFKGWRKEEIKEICRTMDSASWPQRCLKPCLFLPFCPPTKSHNTTHCHHNCLLLFIFHFPSNDSLPRSRTTSPPAPRWQRWTRLPSIVMLLSLYSQARRHSVPLLGFLAAYRPLKPLYAGQPILSACSPTRFRASWSNPRDDPVAPSSMISARSWPLPMLPPGAGKERPSSEGTGAMRTTGRPRGPACCVSWSGNIGSSIAWALTLAVNVGHREQEASILAMGMGEGAASAHWGRDAVEPISSGYSI